MLHICIKYVLRMRKGKKLDQNKTVRLGIRVTEDLKARIQEKAKEENRSMSNYLENIIIEALEKGEKS